MDSFLVKLYEFGLGCLHQVLWYVYMYVHKAMEFLLFRRPWIPVIVRWWTSGHFRTHSFMRRHLNQKDAELLGASYSEIFKSFHAFAFLIIDLGVGMTSNLRVLSDLTTLSITPEYQPFESRVSFAHVAFVWRTV